MVQWKKQVTETVEKELPIKTVLTDEAAAFTVDVFLGKEDPDLKADTMLLRLNVTKHVDGDTLYLVCRPLEFDGSVKKAPNLETAPATAQPEVVIAKISLPEVYQRAIPPT